MLVLYLYVKSLQLYLNPNAFTLCSVSMWREVIKFTFFIPWKLALFVLKYHLDRTRRDLPVLLGRLVFPVVAKDTKMYSLCNGGIVASLSTRYQCHFRICLARSFGLITYENSRICHSEIYEQSFCCCDQVWNAKPDRLCSCKTQRDSCVIGPLYENMHGIYFCCRYESVISIGITAYF